MDKKILKMENENGNCDYMLAVRDARGFPK